MAIVQASMTEEILSRQEKAVIRGIYRAQQLSEALSALDKISVYSQSFGVGKTEDTSAIENRQYTELRRYLASAIHSALVSTKVPASALVVKETPSTQK